MLTDQENFLKNEFMPLLRKVDPLQKGKWGKMDGQQMVEHLRDVFKLANGKIVLPMMVKEPEKLAEMMAFVMSDWDFPKNLRVPVVPEEPVPHKYATIAEALDKTEKELQDVFTAYQDPGTAFVNPICGELNYDQQVRLLYKHTRHHLRQFGLLD